jgi:hypothetical protein
MFPDIGVCLLIVVCYRQGLQLAHLKIHFYLDSHLGHGQNHNIVSCTVSRKQWCLDHPYDHICGCLSLLFDCSWRIPHWSGLWHMDNSWHLPLSSTSTNVAAMQQLKSSVQKKCTHYRYLTKSFLHTGHFLFNIYIE